MQRSKTTAGTGACTFQRCNCIIWTGPRHWPCGGDPMTEKRRRKGRPPIDDRDAVLGYVASRVNAGASVSEAARHGLAVIGWERRQDGRWALTKRRLGPAALERRYRAMLAELISPLVTNLPEGTRYIGI